MRIQNLSDETAIEALKNGTRLRRLKDDILVYEPSTFTEAMAMATKMIKMDKDRSCGMMMTKRPPKMMIGSSLGNSDLSVPFSEVWQELQLVDFEKRLKTIHLSMLRDQKY